VTPEQLGQLRDQLGLSAIAHELQRMRRLLEHARHPTRTPEREYDDLEVMLQELDEDHDVG